jgi:hypothetical protein
MIFSRFKVTFLVNQIKLPCSFSIFCFKNGFADFDILVTILRDLDKLQREKSDEVIQHSNRIQQSSDDDDSDEEHDRALKRNLQSIQQLESNKETQKHDALDQLIRQNENEDSDSEESVDSDHSGRNKRSRNQSDSESEEDRSSQSHTNIEEDRSSQSHTNIDGLSTYIKNEKIPREKSNLASFNHSPPDTLISTFKKISTLKNKRKK